MKPGMTQYGIVKMAVRAVEAQLEVDLAPSPRQLGSSKIWSCKLSLPLHSCGRGNNGEDYQTTFVLGAQG